MKLLFCSPLALTVLKRKIFKEIAIFQVFHFENIQNTRIAKTKFKEANSGQISAKN
jgi:hypothetical protein